MKALVFSMLAMAAMVSCTSESDPINEADGNGKTPVQFKSSILIAETKATPGETETSFAEGELVGITMYKGDNAPTGVALGTPSNSNTSFTVGDDGTLSETAVDKTMYWQRLTKHYFYAYYPIATGDSYTAATGNTAELITVKTNTTGETADLLMGKIETGITFTGTVVEDSKITFAHKLSKIKFILKKDNSFIGTANLTAISIELNTDATVINLVEQSASASGSPITLTKSGLNTTIVENAGNALFADWSPIVGPEATITKLNFTIDETIITATNVNADLESGQITTITITLKAGAISLSSDITPWGNQAGSGDII